MLKEKQIEVLIIAPDGHPKLTKIDNSLEAKQSVVGGLIACVYPFEDMVALVCNDEGKLDGLPLNRALVYEGTNTVYDIIAGTFFVAGITDDGEFRSLTKAEADKFNEMFYSRERFARSGDDIYVFKVDTVPGKSHRDNDGLEL